MLAGKPIIGSHIGGIPEQIDHDRTGVLIAPGNPNALANAILELASDRAKRESLGLAAKKGINESWAPQTQGRLLAELYCEVIKRHFPQREGGSRLDERRSLGPSPSPF
jgi:glycosyltransferase involved in cell wall biosynthesis